jgi:predicted nucleic acid-binding protein
LIFVDTWAWLALAYAKDPYHQDAAEQHRRFQAGNHRYVTTDFVLNELISALFASVPFEQSRRFMDGLFRSFESGCHRLVFVSPEQFHEAYRLRLTYHDKPGISFVDLTSMVVMRALGLADVFTGDAHFRQVGMGFHLYP